MNYSTPQYSQFVADSSQDVRTAFIRKVYTLLFGSILTTVIAGVVASGFTQTLLPLMPIIGIATFVCMLGLVFTKQIPGVNAALFFLFAVLQGVILGPYLAYLEARLPGDRARRRPRCRQAVPALALGWAHPQRGVERRLSGG